MGLDTNPGSKQDDEWEVKCLFRNELTAIDGVFLTLAAANTKARNYLWSVYGSNYATKEEDNMDPGFWAPEEHVKATEVIKSSGEVLLRATLLVPEDIKHYEIEVTRMPVSWEVEPEESEG